MQRDLCAVQKVGVMRVHMRHLAALLAGVQPGAGRLESGAVGTLGGKPGDRGGGARVEPEPGIGDRGVILPDQPGAVALCGDGDGRRARCQTVDPVAKAAQGGGAVGPCIGERLRDRAIPGSVITVGDGRDGDLATAKVEGHGLDDRGARVDPDQNITARHHVPSIAVACPTRRSLKTSVAHSGPARRGPCAAHSRLPFRGRVIFIT